MDVITFDEDHITHYLDVVIPDEDHITHHLDVVTKNGGLQTHLSIAI